MNDLEAPPVPKLSDLRISTRQAHLVREITMDHSHWRRGGLTIGSAALVAVVATVALVLAGPGSANAFAAWTPAPTTPAPGQVSNAVAACETGAAQPPPGAVARGVTGTTQVSLVDTRGPFTLVLFGANTSTQGALMCVSGPSVSPHPGSQMSQSNGSPPAPGPGQITLDRLQGESADDGQPYTIAEGSVGSGVMAVTLTVSDGSNVVATTGNGLFLAWWPGSAVVTSATLTTATGMTSQPIDSPTRDTGS